MYYILDLIETGDVCSLVVLVFLLVYIGQYLVSTNNRLKLWGQRAAIFTAVTYAIYASIDYGYPDPSELVGIVFRALLAAGLILGFCWIAFPVVAFVHHHTFGAISQAASNRRLRREASRRQQDTNRHEGWLAELEEAKRQQAESRQRAEANLQRQREDARARCELFYNLYRADFGQRFTKKMFNDYFTRYLGDNKSPEEVALRAEQLMETMQQALEKAAPPKDFQSVAEINEWFDAQRREIEESNISDALQKVLLIELEDGLDQQVRQFLRRKRS